MGFCWELVLLMVLVILKGGEGKLVENFYNYTCPNVDAIVKHAVTLKFKQTPATIPGTLRLFFHDCFIQGCDASIMISSPNWDAEKDAPDNLSLAGDGFDTVIKAKEAVEAECPGVVSCADIVALAARDVIVLAGGPSFGVQLGRRDGLISKKSQVNGKLPDPSFSLTQLNTMFADRNLSQIDMIALSGAHKIGFSHCSRIMSRLYPVIDPSLDSEYAKQLMLTCKENADPQTVVNLVPENPIHFDNSYYQNLLDRKGLFTSDQVLFDSPASKPTVMEFAKNPFAFYKAFVHSMRKLGRVGVKTGKQGEIRRDCRTFNS